MPQGRFISEIGDGMLAALGPERSTWCYRQRSFLAAGLPAARQLGPPGGAGRAAARHPRHGQPADRERAALQLRRRRSRAEEAIRCYTLHSAHAAFRENDLGSLEPGKLADFAVLSADPTAIDPEGIAAIEVLATVVGGRVAHDRLGLG